MVTAALLTGAGYYLTSLLGLALRLPGSTPSVLWPPNAVLTAALLLTPVEWWSFCLLAALPGHLLVQLPTGWPFPMIAVLFITNCTEAIVGASVARTLARSAYRRPPTDAELEVLLSVFDLGRENKLGYTGALGLMLKAVLVSPQFLYITPAEGAPAAKKIVPLDDYQLASRLSYLLWATMPDAELAALADAGTLHEPPVLRRQVKRLLLDPRSRAAVGGV